MKDANNFKIYFTEILKNKYSMNKESIEGYWSNKEKEEKFDNKKLIGTIVGVGELVGAATLSGVIHLTDVNLSALVILFGGAGVLTTKIYASINNPYRLKEYRAIDQDYNNEKTKYKKINRRYR
ncbi:MAG: hypothetical protein IJO43_01490 [Bacilli bacterium]|nr:hypothetical protein [Bacilli bacterium]